MGERRRRSHRGTLTVGLVLLGLVMVPTLVLPPILPGDATEQIDPAAGRQLSPGSCRFLIRRAGDTNLLATEWRPTADGIRYTRLGESATLSHSQLHGGNAHEAIQRRCFVAGTDRLGRDVLLRLLHGGRISLAIGISAALLAALLGSAVGGVAGGGGPLVDGLLMRGVDALLAFPRLFLVIAAAAFLPLRPWLIVLLLAATGWMGTARLVRGEVRSLLGRPFIASARAIGVSGPRLLGRHLLPNAMTPALVDLTSRAGDIILAEAALSFLGLGIQPPTPSWGTMIASGATTLIDAWWVSLLPGIAITITVLGLNLLGDGLTGWLDPRQR